MRRYHKWMLSLLVLAVFGAMAAGWLMTITALRSEATALEQSYKAEQAEADRLEAELATRALLPAGMGAQYIGEFFCTSYDKNCSVCGTTDICYSGEPFIADVSCALNKSMLEKLPIGTWLYIEGIGIRRVSDIGGGVNQNQIDIAVAGTHTDALRWEGYGIRKVYVIGDASCQE